MVTGVDSGESAASAPPPATDDVPGSSAGTANREEDLERASVLFTAGKCDYVAAKYDCAVGSLTEACEIYGTVLGEMTDDVRAFQCRLYYGKVLLELARMETPVFNNAIDGVKEGGVVDIVEEGQEEEEQEAAPTDGDADKDTAEGDDAAAPAAANGTSDDIVVGPPMTDEEQAEVHEQVERAMEEAPVADDKEADAEKSTGDKDEAAAAVAEQTKGDDEAQTKTTGDGETAEKGADGDAAVTSTTGDKEEGEQDGDGDEEDGPEAEAAEGDDDAAAAQPEDDEEPGNLQLAFETLDLCRVIALKHTSAEWRERLFESLLVLAEVGVLNETLGQAMDDLRTCIGVQKEVLPADDRRIAEAHYQLAKCHVMKGEYDEALAEFTNAKGVIAARKERVAADDDESKELDALLPEIQAQMDDCVESKKNALEVKEAEQSEAMSVDTDKDKHVTDVTNLVRKTAKRVSDATEGSEAKRVKVDEPAAAATNGHEPHADTVANGTKGQANGDAAAADPPAPAEASA